MPTVRVDDEFVDVPSFMPGVELLNNPVVKEKTQGQRTAIMVHPGTQAMEIIDPAKQYELRDGTQIETTAPSISGLR